MNILTHGDNIMLNKPLDLNTSINVGEVQKRQLASRLTLESAHLGKILIFTFGQKTRDDKTSSRVIIDAWADSIKAQFRDLPPRTSWYHLNDFSGTDMNPSPYFIARVSEITRQRPDLKGHSAIVIPRNIFTQAMFNLAQRVRPKHINVRLFFKRDEAQQWLESHLEPAASITAFDSQSRR
jgi:hypothetical protein